ncbi:MAG TPA: formate dehydrogenase accessory sulfurtransferase FdhD [Gammaproteobacteria bacterium]|jgi:FdhD protein
MGELKSTKRRQGLRQVEVQRVAEESWTDEDFVATEEPLEIRLSHVGADKARTERSLAITMRTPGNDDELAAGFLLSEGIIKRRADLVSVTTVGPPAPSGLFNVVCATLADHVAVELERLERHFYTSSSCGVCGKASLAAVAVHSQYDVRATAFKIERGVLGALPTKLIAEQSVFERTGGLHASGLFDASGGVLAVREDVGRHNALDKLIGSRLLADGLPLAEFGILVSGRASFELMQKALIAGCPLVAAVGAPSSLAVDLAREFGMTLVGFLKRDRFNVYTRPDRISTGD